MGSNREPGTQSGKRRSIALFSNFLQEEKLNPLPPLGSDGSGGSFFSLSDLSLSLFRKFATFVCEHPSDGEFNYFGVGTCLQHISHVKTHLESLYGIDCFEKADAQGIATYLGQQSARFGSAPEWHTVLRADVSKFVMKRCIDQCIPIKQKSDGCYEKELLTLGRFLLQVIC